ITCAWAAALLPRSLSEHVYPSCGLLPLYVFSAATTFFTAAIAELSLTFGERNTAGTWFVIVIPLPDENGSFAVMDVDAFICVAAFSICFWMLSISAASS